MIFLQLVDTAALANDTAGNEHTQAALVIYNSRINVQLSPMSNSAHVDGTMDHGIQSLTHVLATSELYSVEE